MFVHLFRRKTSTNNFATVQMMRVGSKLALNWTRFLFVESVLLITSKVLFVYICKSSYALKPVYVLNYILNVC